MMNKEVDQFGEVFPSFDKQKKGHFGINKLPGDSVEVDFDRVLRAGIGGGVDCLGIMGNKILCRQLRNLLYRFIW